MRVMIAIAFGLLALLTVAGETGKNESNMDTRQLTRGKELFAQRCAICHNLSGDKALPTGLPLNQRKLSSETIARAVDGRFKGASEADRASVKKYIQSFLK